MIFILYFNQYPPDNSKSKLYQTPEKRNNQNFQMASMNSTTIPSSTIESIFNLMRDGKISREEATTLYDKMSETSSMTSGSNSNSTMSSLSYDEDDEDDEDCVHSERKVFNSMKNQKKNNRDLSRFTLDFEELEEKETIYPNQHLAAKKIYNTFLDRKNVITIGCGKTQSGKTGTMLAVIREFACCTIDPVPIANIFIISGLSSKEWKTQTKARVPECLRDRVYARDDLKKKMNLENKQNVLIVMDETQIAAKQGQSIDSIFNDLGINGENSANFLFKNNIKIVQFSATPNGTLLNAMKRTDIVTSKVMINPGPDYKSCTDYLDDERVRGTFALAGDFYDPEKMEELKGVILSFSSPRYHIIRMPKCVDDYNQAEENLSLAFPSNEFDICKYDQDHSDFEINNMLSSAPERHTFILFKEMGRCAKTYHKQFIGVWVERYSRNPDHSVGIQGLLGRATGYDDNGEQIIYTNMVCIERYQQLWESEFSGEVEWKSNTTVVKQNSTIPRATYNASAEDNEGGNKHQRNSDNWEFREFASWDILIETCKNEANLRRLFGKRGHPNATHKINSDGQYYKKHHLEDKVFTYDEIKNQCVWKGWGNNARKKGASVYPCYHDPNDLSTLVWVLIYNSNA